MKRCLRCGETFTADGWRCPACGTAPESNGYVMFAPDLAGGDEGFALESFEWLAELEAESFWFRSRNELIVWAIRRYLPDARSLFEVGCGTGFVLAGLRRAFPDLRLTGGEVSLAGLEVAKRRVHDIDFFQLDARRLPFEAEFDVVGAFDLLEHVAEDEAAIAELTRAARPGGGVVITVPQHPRLWSQVDEFSRHKRRYTRHELVSKLEQGGLQVRMITSFVTLLLGPMWLSRLRSRRAATFDPLQEHRIGARANHLLERTMAVERSLIRRGVDLPIGGSLLVVAERS